MGYGQAERLRDGYRYSFLRSGALFVVIETRATTYCCFTWDFSLCDGLVMSHPTVEVQQQNFLSS